MSSALLGAYNRQQEGLPPVLKDSVSATLFQCLLAVDETLSKSKQSSNGAGYEEINKVIVGNKVVSLPVSGPNPTFRSLLKAPPPSVVTGEHSKGILIGTYDDDFQHSQCLRAAEKVEYSMLEELEAFEHRALARRQAPNLLKQGFSLAAEASMTRSIDECELMTFTELPHEEWYRLHKLQQAHDLLNTVSKPLPAFTKQQEKAELLKAKASEETKESGDGDSDSVGEAVLEGPSPSLVMNRTLYRSYSALSFSQVLIAESSKEPQVLKRYYKHTDELLLILAWPAPDRRLGAKSWVPTDNMTTAAALKVLGSSGENYRHDTLNVYPTGKAVVLAKQMMSTGSAWVSFFLDGSCFGLRHVDDLSNADRKRSEFAEGTQVRKASDNNTGGIGASEGGENEEKNGSIGEDEAKGNEEDGASEGKEGEQSVAPSADDVGEQEQEQEEQKEEEEQEEEELDEEEKAARAEAAAKARQEELERKREEERLAKEARDKAAAEAKPAIFTYCGADNVRVNVVSGPCMTPNLKPDKHGTVVMSISDTKGSRVSVCSNGLMRIEGVPAEVQKAEGEEGLGLETARTISNLGTITRALTGGPYLKDILYLDGSRVLILDPNFDFKAYRRAHPDKHNHTNKHTNKGKSSSAIPKMPGFHEKVLDAAPAQCVYIRLDSTGSLTYHANQVGTPEVTSKCTSGGAQMEILKDIRKHCVDAQTAAQVSSFMDGRVVVEHANKVTDLAWPDGTRTIIGDGKEGKVIYITKLGFPSVECDLEIEEMCHGHSLGKQVTLSKGGERVRSRLSLNDGSALLIKYDTRITATTNGSLKLVRRDRTVITANDEGEVQVFPKEVWDAAAANSFVAECKDTYVPMTNPTALIEESSSPAIAVGKSTSVVNATNNAFQAPGIHGSTSLVAEASSNTAKSPPPPSGPSADTLATLNTTYKFQINKESVSIADDEYNRFQISLGDVLNPAVDLAGEVSGLKPVAITERPLDPRLFIVNRDGDATEVVSDSVLADWIKQANDCDDVVMVRATIAQALTDMSPDDHHQHQLILQQQQQQPLNAAIGMESSVALGSIGPGAGLDGGAPNLQGGSSVEGPAQDPSFSAVPMPLQSLCFQKRYRQGSPEDTFAFHEVYGARPWQATSLPAVALMDAKMARSREQEHKRHQEQREANAKKRGKGRNKAQATTDAVDGDGHGNGDISTANVALTTPKLFQTLTLTQKTQAMARLHQQVSQEYDNWSSFLASREGSMDRFDVTDYRPQDEQDEEAALAEKLEAIYKALKKKKKKQSVNAANMQYNDGIDETGEEEGQNAAIVAPLGTNDSQELLDLSINSDDGSDTVRMKMEKKNTVPPLEVELNCAFADFANPDGAVLELKELRSALIQIFNIHVPGPVIEQAVSHVAPHLMQEGATGSGLIQGARLVVGAHEAVASPLPHAGQGLEAGVTTATAELISPDPSVEAPPVPEEAKVSRSVTASTTLATLAEPAVAAAVQGLTRTEFGAVYEAVEFLMKAPEEAVNPHTEVEMGHQDYDDGQMGQVPIGRSQSEPANVVLARENGTAAAAGIPCEPSQISAWGALEQSSSNVEDHQARTSAEMDQGSSSQEPSMERLSKTAPGKPQNPNQHWYPETEDILNTSPTKVANKGSVPQGSARNAAAAARQQRV